MYTNISQNIQIHTYIHIFIQIMIQSQYLYMDTFQSIFERPCYTQGLDKL